MISSKSKHCRQSHLPKSLFWVRFGCQIASFRHLWQPCLPKRSYLAPNSDQLGTFGQPCWPKGGPRGAMLSPSCSIWVPSWSTFGAKGLLFGTFGSHVGHKASQGHIGRRQNSDFGDSCVKTRGPSKTHVLKIHNCLKIHCLTTQLS